jgi:hypothetical protein
VWIADGRLHAHNSTWIEGTRAMIEPCRHTTFLGVKAYLPREPELFLERKYGPTWRVPDPSYAKRPVVGGRPAIDAVRLDDAALARLEQAGPGRVWRTEC